MRRARLGVLRRIALFAVCMLLVGCELDETIILRRGGDGTYTVRIAVEKQLGDVLDKIKTELQPKGYVIVSESETTDRKVLVVKREFRDVSELSDQTDTFSLRIDHPSRFKTAYWLSIASTANAASNGFQHRTMRITMPLSITNNSAVTVSGRTVEWDLTKGGTLAIEASGVVLPFGGSLELVAAVILGLAAIVLTLLFLRRGPAAKCTGCGAAIAGGAKFCGSCGAAITAGRRWWQLAAAAICAAAALLICVRGIDLPHGNDSSAPASLASLFVSKSPLVGRWELTKTVFTFGDGTQKTTTDFGRYHLYRTFNGDGTWQIERLGDRNPFKMAGTYNLTDSSHFTSSITQHPTAKFVGQTSNFEFSRHGDELTMSVTPTSETRQANPPVREDLTYVARPSPIP